MRRLARIGIPFLSGVLLALAFPKVDLSLFAWVAFVPLLWVTRGVSLRQAFASGWVAGMGFYLCTVYWVVHTIGLYSNIPPLVAVGPLLMMCAILATYTGVFTAGIRFLQSRGVSVVLFGPPLWVVLEWLRSFFFIGFPWVSLGYSQYAALDLIQFIEFTGIYGLSALVILVNLILFRAAQEKGLPYGAPILATALLIVALMTWGAWRRAQLAALPPAHHLRVGIVQGNVEQAQKWDPQLQEVIISRHERLTREAVARGAQIVIWPETSVPYFFAADIDPDAAYSERLVRFVRGINTPLLFGSPAYRRTGFDVTLSNRAYLLSPEAKVLGSYDKIILAPFGEYIPFHDSFLFFLDKFVVGIGDFAAGTEPTVLALPQVKLGVLICFEGVFPDLARRFVARGADLLVNVTNDAWFGRTSAPYQHLAMEAMRAVENRTPLVRAANTGFSAVVEVDGQIRARSALYEAAVLVEDLAWPEVTSFYAAHGDVFVRLCVAATLIVLGYAYTHKKNSPDGGLPVC